VGNNSISSSSADVLNFTQKSVRLIYSIDLNYGSATFIIAARQASKAAANKRLRSRIRINDEPSVLQFSMENGRRCGDAELHRHLVLVVTA
jgi:hypothetical protein